jgi:hypothetical protein
MYNFHKVEQTILNLIWIGVVHAYVCMYPVLGFEVF